MNEKEEKRLREFQEDARKGVDAYGSGREKLTYPDLLLLLKEDKMLRKLIRSLLKTKQDDDEATPPETSAVEPEPPAPAPKARSYSAPPATVSQDSLRLHLKPELDLLAGVRSDAELAALWLPDDAEPEARQLIRLVALLAQWDQVLRLWDQLAERCKSARRPATAVERRILAAALDIHNLVWRDRAARLQRVESGIAFDFKQHERGVSTGETIRAEWLPGLLNAAGQLQKKPLVET